LFFLADANPYIPAPAWLNSGDTAWQLTAGTFVGLQSIPGLAILYGGLVKKKSALNSAEMCFYAFSSVLLAWVVLGYNMSFGNPWLSVFGQQFVGLPHFALSPDALIGQANIPLAGSAFPPLRMPGAAMIFFQFVFAAITPILIAGSVLGRMNFKAWMLFVPLWSVFVYSVGAFSIWGGGFIAQMGAVDYSGGYVIHLAAGVSGFVAAAVVGARSMQDRKDFEPNNLIMAFASAGILWLGWNGFNGGDPYMANADAGAAVLNTNICTATSLLVWLILDMLVTKKPNAVSMINGMIVGLVAITPGAGYVNGFGAIAIGLIVGCIAWFSLNRINELPLLKRVDDTFGVLHTHGVAGLFGGLMVGVFGDPAMFEYLSSDKKTPPVSVGGWLYGNPKQLWLQFVAAVFIIIYDAIATFIVLKVVSLIVPLRSTEGEMEAGDLAIHGIDPIPFSMPATNGAPTAAETRL
jgi:Amt family ammonium transporter